MENEKPTTTTTFSSNRVSDDGNNIADGDQLFAKIGQVKKLSSDGLNWLKTALDPFPDETRIVPGFPDMISSKSIRYPIKIEKTIGDGGLGASWDCNIAFQGLFGTNKLRSTTASVNTFQSTGQGATDYDVGGFQIRRALTGATLLPTTIVDNLLPTTPANPFRVVSFGMEVQNVTEPLYRSGGCVSYRSPSVPLEVGTSNVSTLTTTAPSAVASVLLRELPISAGEALNLPDSVSDSAENGSYMVGVMDGPTNEVLQVVAAGLNFKNAVLSSGGVTYFPQIVGAALPFGTTGITNSRIPYNQFGCFLTGLSKETKLKVTMHAFIEEFPPPSATLLVSLSKPSATYDPQALMLYSEAIRHLPVAVPVADNFIGSFFLEAAKSIANWAAPKLLKGWDKSDETKELDKIKKELEIIKEMRRLELEQRMAPRPRQIVLTPTGQPKITRTNNSSPPPLPPRDYKSSPKNQKIPTEKKQINSMAPK